MACGGEEDGSGIERGQVRHELDRRVPLVAREHTDAREEILIREGGGESVRVHVPIGITMIFGPGPGLWSASGASRRDGFSARDSFGAETAQ